MFQMKNLVFQSTKIPSIWIEILCFSNHKFWNIDFLHLKFEMLGISSEIPYTSKKMWNNGFLADSMYIL